MGDAFWKYLSAIGTALTLSVIGYIANLGTRVKAVEVTQEQQTRIDKIRMDLQQKTDDDLKEYLKALLDTKFEVVEAKFDGLDNRLGRIERGMNGHLPN
jgi:hypothetical protein